MNICYCGSMAGYPHTEDCPYPMFRGNRDQEAAWNNARMEKRLLAKGWQKGPDGKFDPDLGKGKT